MSTHIPKDLSRFINGEIAWEEIQDLYNDLPVKWLMISSFEGASFYSKDEHDIFEKLCYANILRTNNDFNKEGLEENAYIYSKYLLAKDISLPHKMDWNILLEKIIRENNMSKLDMDEGERNYKIYRETGSWSYIDDYDY